MTVWVCSRMSRVGRSGFSTRCSIVTIAIAPISAQFWCWVVSGTGGSLEYSRHRYRRFASPRAHVYRDSPIFQHPLNEVRIVRIATAYEILLKGNSMRKQSFTIPGNSCQNSRRRHRLCYKDDALHSFQSSFFALCLMYRQIGL
jgi:hypothetical protein